MAVWAWATASLAVFSLMVLIIAASIATFHRRRRAYSNGGTYWARRTKEDRARYVAFAAFVGVVSFSLSFVTVILVTAVDHVT